MKFVARHRSDILDLMKQHHLNEADFDFIKRRGRICTRHRQTGLEFAYLRKKETQLDAFTREWKNVEWFKVKSGGGKEQVIQSWDEVMTLFEEWLHRVVN